ncbi:hypothetical protein PQ455_00955 [Sphingomonas naphthae]|uniref:Uncharacterized protein n=1 Tax=Sphingomonas naphthae TaxID=1813468 RepID=A0ABY7TKS1_9SPHN|nr:hypothetical protein [Sphingomonas naphthae]WCT73832.1 hypothetical protein PQ455_00955 [Sphingomonas naphthae]
MTLDRSAALGAYAGIVTLGLAWALLGGAGPAPTRFDTIDVKRINVREDDGTLRMVIAGRDHIGGLVIDGKEYPHPNRQEAGMIFYNDEGTENGGLVFDGRKVDGKPTNSGHLSFDRWHQDQTLYVQSLEDGPRRRAGLFVQDRPDGPADFTASDRLRAMPEGPAKTAALKAAGYDGSMARAFLGRDYDDASKLVLRDGAGRPRLRLSVAKDGAAAIEFLDETGKVVRTRTAAN